VSKIEPFLFPQAVAAGFTPSRIRSFGGAAAPRTAQRASSSSPVALPKRVGSQILSTSALPQAVDDAPQATGALISYIQRRYHDSHRHDLAELTCLAILAEARHGAEPHAPKGSVALLSRINTRLSALMQQDDAVLFPMMLAGERRGLAPLVKQAIAEHDALLDLLGELGALTRSDKAPAADASWQAFCFGAQEFAGDLAAHLQVKDKVLFPRFL